MPDTTIVDVIGRRVWTAAGEPAFEAEILLACGARGRAIAAPVRDARSDRITAALSPGRTVAAINGLIAAALHGVDARRQDEIDATLSSLALGGDARARRAALSACSIATARAAARANGLPLHRYLRGSHPVSMPLPVIDIFAGGNDASPIRSLSILPFAAEGVDHALELSLSIHRAALDACGAMAPGEYDEITIEALLAGIEGLGLVPGEEVGIVADVGARRLFRDGRYGGPDWSVEPDEWAARVTGWLEAYPISALEEPFADARAAARFTSLTAERARVIADETLGSSADRIATAAAEGSASGVVLRPEAAGTLTDLRVAFEAARVVEWPIFMGGGAIEVDDASVVHLATAWQSGYMKLGAPGQGAGLTRWNEALRIEASLRTAVMPYRVESAARMVH